MTEGCGFTDLSRQKQWATRPANAGHIRDFYRLSEPTPDPVVVEKFFSELESQVAPILKCIDRERRPPNDDELNALLHFMAYQWVRVPRFRPFALEILDRLARQKVAEELQSLGRIRRPDPGHAPDVLPVDGHGCDRWKSCLAVPLRLILPRLSRGGALCRGPIRRACSRARAT
jgi:Protein of unknown function (DUF4238)